MRQRKVLQHQLKMFEGKKIRIRQYKEISGTCCLLPSEDACCSMFTTPCLIWLSHPYYLHFPLKTLPRIFRFCVRVCVNSFLVQFTGLFAFCSFALSIHSVGSNDVLRVRFDQCVMGRELLQFSVIDMYQHCLCWNISLSHFWIAYNRIIASFWLWFFVRYRFIGGHPINLGHNSNISHTDLYLKFRGEYLSLDVKQPNSIENILEFVKSVS